MPQILPAVAKKRRDTSIGTLHPVGADDTPNEPRVREVLEADLTVRLSSRVHHDEVARMSSGEEPFLDPRHDRLGDTHQREAVRGDRGAVRYPVEGLVEADESCHTM